MSEYREAGDGSTAHATATYAEDWTKDEDEKSKQEDLEDHGVQCGYREPMVKCPRYVLDGGVEKRGSITLTRACSCSLGLQYKHLQGGHDA